MDIQRSGSALYEVPSHGKSIGLMATFSGSLKRQEN